MLELMARYQQLLWKLFPKQTESIAGHEIQYAVIPKYLLLGDSSSKTLFPEAMCLVHYPTQSLMILIPTGHTDLRYTLYHEYLEGMSLLEFPIPPYDEKWARFAYEKSYEEIQDDIPDLEERVKGCMERDDESHLFALVLELALMKKELGTEDYQKKLQYTLDYRF
jgi:hypothetical protein